ncbi:hypothetical protein [Hyphococcus sp.]|uniref:hypothetical protein n=1 Tax=Hyphococcus sp. TaxID=2038636 RepID=UPI003D1487FA
MSAETEAKLANITPRPEAHALVRPGDKTAFVLGNGPSLAAIDLRCLSPFATIGLNAAYRHWRQIDWRPRYYSCLDTVVGLSHKDEIAALIEEGRIRKFLLRANLVEAMGAIGHSPDIVIYEEARLQTPLLNITPITTGSHAALWAASLGYEQIVLLGVDANYKEVVEGAARREGIELEIVRDGANPNYYFEGYQAPGDRFNLPNPRPDLHLNAWRRAAQSLKTAGVQTFNGNPASGVGCFPFIDIDAFLTTGVAPTPAKEDIEAMPGQPLAATMTSSDRLRAFLKTYGVKGLIVATPVLFATFLWLAASKPAPLTGAGVVILVLTGLLSAAAGLYARFAILAHLQRLDEEMATLHARVAILEKSRQRDR